MNIDKYSVNWIKQKHMFIKYNEDGNEMLHLIKKFGYTDFSNEIDISNCNLSCDLMWIDKSGEKHKVNYSRRAKFVGRELIIYDKGDSIKFDEWVYIDVSKPMHNIFDINGYELIIGG